jgi:hypothetical protein
MDEKPSNPKDVIGTSKAHLELVPDTAVALMSLAFLEGALKYGRFNWRVAGVRASVYRAAGDRHRKKWWNGEWADPKTRVPHLASSMACDAIILDAHVCGKLIDDRPPSVDFAKLVDEAEENVKHLMQMFAGHSPKQYTIADTQPSVFELSRQLQRDAERAVYDNLASPVPHE